jgi:hypothetical protein
MNADPLDMEMKMTDFTLRMGRMISGSKTAPKGHVCVFNANICIKSRGKIWFGDLDLTTDEDQLKALAAKEGEILYILRERDARLDNEASPLFENAVAFYEPDGSVCVDLAPAA